MGKKATTYSYDEAYEASLKYFGGDELAARVWVSKYALKDSFGNIFEQIFNRHFILIEFRHVNVTYAYFKRTYCF